MYFFKIPLLVFLLTIVSCTKKIDYKNLDFTPQLSSNVEGSIVVNQPVQLRCILLSPDDLTSENVKISFPENNTFIGHLKYGDLILQKGRSFDYKFAQPLLLSFTPTQSGTHNIILDYELGVEKIKRQSTLSIDVNTVQYNVVLKDVPEMFISGKTYPMKLTFDHKTTSSTPSSKVDLTLSATMPQGKGILKIKNTVVFDNTSGSYSSPLSFSSLIYPTKATSITLSSDEVADITFCSVTAGENKLYITATDKYSNTTLSPYSFSSTGATIIANNNITDFKIKYATPFNFALTVAHLTYTGNYQLNIDNSPKNKGLLSYANSALIWGTVISNFTNGVHNYKFTPQDVGKNLITYKISFTNENDKQEYSTIHEIPFDVEPYILTSELKDFSSLSVNRQEEVNFKLDIQEEKSPITPFTLSYNYIKGAGVVKVNGTILEVGKEVIVNKGIQSISYTPSLAGVASISFTIKDMFAQSINKLYSLNVINNTLDAILTQPKDSYINVPVSFSLTASQKDYSGRYYVTYNSSKAGVLKFSNGSILTPNVKTELSTSAITLNYTGTEAGDHKLDFVVTDDYGQTISKSTTLAIKKPHITIVASSANLPTEIETPANFNLKIGGEGYTGQFRLSATGGTSPITVNSTNINNGSILVSSGDIAVSYVPSTVTTHSLKFTITDDYGQTASALVTITGTHKTMAFSASFVAPIQYLGRDTELKLSATGAAPFTVKYSGAKGTLRQNDRLIQSNIPVKFTNSDKWVYATSSIGDHSLLFTAIDKNGQQKTSSAALTAVESEILLSLSTNNNTTLINTPTSTTLNFSNTANDDKLIVKWKCDRGGILNIVDGNEYPTGSLGLQYIPNETPGAKKVEITVEDKFGTSKTLIWNITARYDQISSTIDAPNVYAEHSVNCSYSVTKKQYNGSYYINATSSKKGLNYTNTVAAGTHNFSFIPTSISDNIITLDIKDDQGESVTLQKEIIISYPDIKYTRVYTGIGEHISPYKTYIYTIREDDYKSPKFTVSIERNPTFCYGDANLLLTKINDFTYKVEYVGSGINGESRWKGDVVIKDKFGRTVKHPEDVFFKKETINGN